MIVLAGPVRNDVLKLLHLAGGKKTSVYIVKLIQQRQSPHLVDSLEVPLLFQSSGSFANSSLLAAASVLSQEVRYFLSWTSQVAPVITGEQYWHQHGHLRVTIY